mgnify:CR=1 FL=1
MTESAVLTALINAGGAVIVAVICLFILTRVNQKHEIAIKNIADAHKQELGLITKRVIDIAERDIRSREEYTRTAQSLIEVIKYLTDSFFAARNKP